MAIESRLGMATFVKSLFATQPHFSWKALRDYGLIFLGALLQALAIRLFLVLPTW